jgi:hypothetical protein
VDKAIVMPIGKQDSMGGPYVVSVEDFQNLKMIEDRASDALLCLDSTLDTIVTLAEMHCQYFGTSATGCVSDAPTKSHSDSQLDVAFALKEKERDVLYARKKVEALLL